MPLPIETPAPKASSLIKKFQQTIDALDEPSVPLLPKQRLSVGADDPAYRRRSWAVGSGGASIPQTGVIWKGSHSKSGTETNQPLQSTKTNNETSTTPRLMTIPPTPIDNSTSKSPETPIFQPETPIEKSSNTSNRLKQSVEPQIDKLSHIKAKVIKSAVSSIPSDRPKASVSADVPTVRTRKVTNITAPTAASLAKIRSSDSPIPDTGHQSNLLPKVKPDSIINHHHSKLPHKKSNLQQIRLPSSPPLQTNQRIRAASAAPKSRTSHDSSSSTNNNTSTIKSSNLTNKSKSSPPIPPFGAGPGLRAQNKSPTPKKARSYFSPTTNTSSKTSNTPTTRPVTRARVASIATPISTRKNTIISGTENITPKSGTGRPKTPSNKTIKTATLVKKSGTTVISPTPTTKENEIHTDKGKSSIGSITPKKLSKPFELDLPLTTSPSFTTQIGLIEDVTRKELEEQDIVITKKEIEEDDIVMIKQETEVDDIVAKQIDGSHQALIEALGTLELSTKNPTEDVNIKDLIDLKPITKELEESNSISSSLVSNEEDKSFNEDQIHIATSSTGSTSESLTAIIDKKKSTKRRSGVAAW